MNVNRVLPVISLAYRAYSGLNSTTVDCHQKINFDQTNCQLCSAWSQDSPKVISFSITRSPELWQFEIVRWTTIKHNFLQSLIGLIAKVITSPESWDHTLHTGSLSDSNPSSQNFFYTRYMRVYIECKKIEGKRPNVLFLWLAYKKDKLGVGNCPMLLYDLI